MVADLGVAHEVFDRDGVELSDDEASEAVAQVVKPQRAQPSGALGAPVVLDVTNADQVAALPAALSGSLDAVVNNAGIVVSGPMEGVPLDDLRRQLEVNVVGQVAVTQAVLPLLRASRGRVVFVSSLSGRVATPMTGPYNASKFARGIILREPSMWRA